jgi:GT2 family glycosyltransferase
MDKEGLLLSIVIPTRNKAPRLHLTLSSLVVQDPGEDWEIIIVNDGSTDHTEQVILAMAPWLPLHTIEGPGNGRAAARNCGARAAAGDILLFLDDDILACPLLVYEHLRRQRYQPALVHGKLRELIGAAKLADPSTGGPGFPRLDVSVIRTDGFSAAGCRLTANALEKAVEMMYEEREAMVTPWLIGVGANLSIHRSLWEAHGGFNEAFGMGWGCEDLEFSFRLHQKNVRLDFAPEAMGVHLTHHNPTRWSDHDKNLLLFRKLHPFPEIDMLVYLLSPDGSPDSYFRALGR